MSETEEINIEEMTAEELLAMDREDVIDLSLDEKIARAQIIDGYRFAKAQRADKAHLLNELRSLFREVDRLRRSQERKWNQE